MSVHIEPSIFFIAPARVLGPMRATTIVTRGAGQRRRDTKKSWHGEFHRCQATPMVRANGGMLGQPHQDTFTGCLRSAVLQQKPANREDTNEGLHYLADSFSAYADWSCAVKR